VLYQPISFSINSFEWNEVNKDGKYEPTAGEIPVNMGVSKYYLIIKILQFY
jgi:hypothetical protein